VRNDSHMIDELCKIGVDPKAYGIFVQKAHYNILKMDALSCAQANVLKQTALLCGADAAIPRKTYFGGRKRKTSVLLFANDRELSKIRERLVEQDWLLPIAHEIERFMKHDVSPIMRACRKTIKCTRTLIMGIINVTPDSFYSKSRYNDPGAVRNIVHEMEAAGVDIIDVGAESSRPGVKPTPVGAEIARLKHVLPIIAKSTKKPISIDTYKSKVALYAIDTGASIVNDISALRFDKKMPSVIARTKVGVILMHMKGTPHTMQRKPRYNDLMHEIHAFFKERLDCATQLGIAYDRIIVDPGLGFGKRLVDNYRIIDRLEELSIFGRPVCVGHSRKSFIGKPDGSLPEKRLEGSLGLASLLIQNGAHILRVHDVKEIKKVSLVTDKVLS